MTTMASQITSLTIVYSIVYSGTDQRKHQSSSSLDFVWGFHRDRWILRTKGQLRGKYLHLMTSSWYPRNLKRDILCFVVVSYKLVLQISFRVTSLIIEPDRMIDKQNKAQHIQMCSYFRDTITGMCYFMRFGCYSAFPHKGHLALALAAYVGVTILVASYIC